MGRESKISWTHSTFNPWIGCTKVSAGCAHCYAEATMDTRWGRVKWGDNGTRSKTSEKYWRDPIRWNADAIAARERRRVFCASLADVFEDRDELIPWRSELMDLIIATPQLDWLLLTKRPENIDRMVGGWTNRHNVWLGTSVENQETANERIPKLMQCGAAVLFLSCEPLLGPIDLTDIIDAPDTSGG